MAQDNQFSTAPIQLLGEICISFLQLGIDRFDMAAQYVQQLPYGRNTDADFRLVLQEGRGTCSTKHALLAQLAQELHIPCDLVLGIYKMNGQNTPKIGSILTKYHLPYIPEAHCYLIYQQARWDFTQVTAAAKSPFDFLLYEKRIQPHQIGPYKQSLHKSYMKNWLTQHERGQSIDLTTCWQIREECISAMSSKT